MADHKVSRRRALGSVGAVVAGTVAGSRIAGGQTPAAQRQERAAWEPPVQVRLAPREELVNILEYEDEAKKKLAPATFALIAGGDRALFDRITLRPRMLSPTIDMDLSVHLFGDQHFTPILVAPMAEQRRFHPDAELATARGATAAKALMIVSSRSSMPLDQIAAEARPSFWYQVYASDAAAKSQVQDAVKAG